MIGQRFATAPTDASPSTFAEALHQLKARGCLVLVVGPVGDDAKYMGCRRLLGDELSRNRRRLFVTTDDGVAKHPGAKATCSHGEPDDSRAITYQTSTRGTTAIESGSTAVMDHDVVDGGLRALSVATHDAIDELSARAGGLSSGELRVCIDDLDTMIANHDDVDVVEFISGLRQCVLATEGMAHAHITREAPGIPVDAIVSYFDAIVEVDSSGKCRQRWHVREPGITTDWLEL